MQHAAPRCRQYYLSMRAGPPNPAPSRAAASQEKNLHHRYMWKVCICCAVANHGQVHVFAGAHFRGYTGKRAVMPEYEVFVLSFPHATNSSTIPVRVLFCLTFFVALPKAGSSFCCWRCCSLLCPWRFFDLNMKKSRS